MHSSHRKPKQAPALRSAPVQLLEFTTHLAGSHACGHACGPRADDPGLFPRPLVFHTSPRYAIMRSFSRRFASRQMSIFAAKANDKSKRDPASFGLRGTQEHTARILLIFGIGCHAYVTPWLTWNGNGRVELSAALTGPDPWSSLLVWSCSTGRDAACAGQWQYITRLGGDAHANAKQKVSVLKKIDSPLFQRHLGGSRVCGVFPLELRILGFRTRISNQLSLHTPSAAHFLQLPKRKDLRPQGSPTY